MGGNQRMKLTDEKIEQALNQGAVRRKAWPNYIIRLNVDDEGIPYFEQCDLGFKKHHGLTIWEDIYLSVEDIFSNDWEVVGNEN